MLLMMMAVMMVMVVVAEMVLLVVVVAMANESDRLMDLLEGRVSARQLPIDNKGDSISV